jgi:hypothetical protein
VGRVGSLLIHPLAASAARFTTSTFYVDFILVSAVAPQINFFKDQPYDSYSYEDSAMIDGGIYD